MTLASPVGRLRVVGMCEAISFLVLLGIAMPLKYFAGFPLAVEITGWVHGVLFIGYLIALGVAWWHARWHVGFVFLLGLAALVPGGPFIADRWLRSDEREP